MYGSSSRLPLVSRTGLEIQKSFTFSTNRAEATYDICTASGDVMILEVVPYVTTLVQGLTSVTAQTDSATPQEYLAAAEALLAGLTAGKTVVNATRLTRHLLLSTKKLRGTITGAGSGGVITFFVRFTPITETADLV